MCQPEAGILGCRNLAVSAGKDGNNVDSSAYYTSAIGQGTDTSEFLDANGWNVSGPLTLCAGVIDAAKAPLNLQSDVTFAVSLPLSNCLCRQYLAAGSTGSLYCGAHADPLDFTLTIDSFGTNPSGPATLVAGPSVSQEGEVRMTFQSKVTSIDANAAACTPAACATALAAETADAVAYTSGTATSEFTNSRQGGTVNIKASGRPFDDDPQDGVADCEDWVSGPSVGALGGAPEHDADNADAGNKDVVTVERLSE